MSQPERTAYPTEAALDRLAIDKSDEVRERARKLGQLVWRNLDIANTKPSMQFANGDTGKGKHVAPDQEYRVGKRQGAWLNYLVPAKFQDLERTPDWLPHTEQVILQFNTYDFDLPDVDRLSGTDIPDWVSDIRFYLAPAPEYKAGTKEPRDQLYAGSYEDGSRLDVPDTETVIGILALIADKVENS